MQTKQQNTKLTTKDKSPHIAFFGKRNVGKSSIINYITEQELSIVSSTAGTTTDPVKKSIELHNFAPCIVIDTAGIDDVGMLGQKRIKKTDNIIKQIDLAIVVIAKNNFDYFEIELIKKLNSFAIPFFVIHNKEDEQAITSETTSKIDKLSKNIVKFSTKENKDKSLIINKVKELLPEKSYKQISLISDLVKYGDIVLLITPIDNEAPAGRMILPQVQTIRDSLDNDCTVIITKERELDVFLRKTKIKPKLVITDSQIFPKADASISKDIMLTSFSILLARQKGNFYKYIEGTPQIAKLKNNDNILLLESCTHQTSCDDIGRVKIPRWINNFTGKKLNYDIISGLDEIENIEKYALVVQCGGCVVTHKQLKNRLKEAIDANIPVTNYGMAIAFVHGIFNRAVQPFLENNYLII